MKHCCKMLVFATTVIMVLSTQCMNPAQHTGNGSDVGNGMITGLIYGPDGKTAAVGAKVYLRKKQSLADTMGVLAKRGAAADTATAITDENGTFVIDSVDTGIYVIESSDLNNNLAFKDSVFISGPDTTITVPPDTLKPAGALKGAIRLSEGGDPRKVFVLAFGIDRFARVNEDGSFRFVMLAEGKYDLRIIASLDDYGVLDTLNIPVISADTTNLDTIDLPFTGIPTPKGISLSYDTMKQIVTLTWSKDDTKLVNGYYVYRRNVDSNTVFSRINTSPVTDTVYRDTKGIQDQSYEYRVSAIDKNATEGVKSARVSVKVAGAFAVGLIIDSINGTSFKPFGLFVKDTHLYIADSWAKKILEVDLNGNFISEFGASGADSGEFTSPHDLVIDGDGNYWIADFSANRIQKLDSNRIFIKSWTIFSDSTGDSIQLIEPTKLAVDDSNSIYILANSTNWQVIKINKNGVLQSRWSIGGNRPIGINIDNQQRLAVAADGMQLKYFAGDGLEDHNISLAVSGAEEIAIDSNGIIYTHNSQLQEIQIFDQSGANISRFSSSGEAGGDMVVAANGDIFFGSLWPGKIEIFRRNK